MTPLFTPIFPPWHVLTSSPGRACHSIAGTSTPKIAQVNMADSADDYNLIIRYMRLQNPTGEISCVSPPWNSPTRKEDNPFETNLQWDEMEGNPSRDLATLHPDVLQMSADTAFFQLIPPKFFRKKRTCIYIQYTVYISVYIYICIHPEHLKIDGKRSFPLGVSHLVRYELFGF